MQGNWLPDIRTPEENIYGGSYTETVQEAQASILLPVELKFDLANRTVTCAGQTIQLPPAQLALMFWLAIRKKRGQNETEKAICLNRDYNLIAEFLPCYKRVLPPASQDYENTVRTQKDHADFVPYFRSTRSNASRSYRFTRQVTNQSLTLQNRKLRIISIM